MSEWNYGSKGKMRVTRTFSIWQNNKQKQCHIVDEIAKISATIKDLKDAGMVIPPHPIQLTYLDYVESGQTLENESGLS